MAITASGGVGAGARTGGLRRKHVSAGRGRGGYFAPLESEPMTPEAVPPQLAPIYAPCLLAVQEDEPEGAVRNGRAQAIRHGHDVLDCLEELRRALVAGLVAKARLQDLVRALAAERTPSADPRLEGLIAEIELRAQVGFAKLTRPDPPERPLSGPSFRYI